MFGLAARRSHTPGPSCSVGKATPDVRRLGVLSGLGGCRGPARPPDHLGDVSLVSARDPARPAPGGRVVPRHLAPRRPPAGAAPGARPRPARARPGPPPPAVQL